MTGNEWVNITEWISRPHLGKPYVLSKASCKVADELSPTDQRAVQMSGCGGSGSGVANAGGGGTHLGENVQSCAMHTDWQIRTVDAYHGTTQTFHLMIDLIHRKYIWANNWGSIFNRVLAIGLCRMNERQPTMCSMSINVDHITQHSFHKDAVRL